MAMHDAWVHVGLRLSFRSFDPAVKSKYLYSLYSALGLVDKDGRCWQELGSPRPQDAVGLALAGGGVRSCGGCSERASRNRVLR